MGVPQKSGLRSSPEGARTAAGGHAASRNEAAPALFKLLADSALYRAAFAACGFPMALLDASASSRPLVHVNPAFERCFGLNENEVKGRPFASALCRGDEASVARLLDESASGASLKVWRKDGSMVEIEACAGAVHDSGGARTHWLIAFYDAAEAATRRAERGARGPGPGAG